MNTLRARLAWTAFLLCFTVTSSGCAITSKEQAHMLEPHKKANFPQVTIDCIFLKTLYDWKVIDPYHMIVWAPNRKTAYLIEFDVLCSEARFAHLIAFTGRDGRLCGFGKDSVVIPGPIPKRCPIGAIYPLTESDLATWLQNRAF